ncbi:MAG: archaemetzincin family Zn-dependent metalloprotease [Candidatus Helarchaeota archaeon]|nr:archaemetzincin family Zn-dependent metalloprotease [Candidatus Helarchaeota archaeon]
MIVNSKALIVPLGNVEKDVLLFLTKELFDIFRIEFKISPPLDIPKSSYNSKRAQYYSSILLSYLKRSAGTKFDLILGVIDEDLYVPQLNFVFGEAELNGNAAIISLTRLRQEFYGLPGNKNTFYQRTIKEAVHELGHVFGLHHCRNPGCVMFFSNSLFDTDRKEKHFCKNCLKKLPLIK